MMTTQQSDDEQAIPPITETAGQETATSADAPQSSGQEPATGSEGPPLRANGPLRHLRGTRPVKPRPNPELGPVGPLAPEKEKKPRFVPLREEYSAICMGDDGRPNCDTALVLQQLCRMQSRVDDKVGYVDEETHHARIRPRRLRGGTAGWFPASAAKLSKELFGAIREKTVGQAPVARLLEAIYPSARAWTPASARSFTKHFMDDHVSVARILACGMAGAPSVDREAFVSGVEANPGEELLAFNAVRHNRAWELYLADPGTECLFDDLAPKASEWHEEHNLHLHQIAHAILREAKAGPPRHLPMNRTQFRDALLLLWGTGHEVLPIDPADMDEIRAKVLADCAASNLLREKILALEPGYLGAKVSLTPEEIRDEAARHIRGLTDRWARWQAVYAALTGTITAADSPARPSSSL